jgi:hypothetical protein
MAFLPGPGRPEGEVERGQRQEVFFSNRKEIMP